jgi:hypothetical protein
MGVSLRNMARCGILIAHGKKARQSRINGENNIFEWVSLETHSGPAESKNIYMAPINLFRELRAVNRRLIRAI